MRLRCCRSSVWPTEPSLSIPLIESDPFAVYLHVLLRLGFKARTSCGFRPAPRMTTKPTRKNACEKSKGATEKYTGNKIAARHIPIFSGGRG